MDRFDWRHNTVKTAEEVNQRISEVVDERWATRGRPVLLSMLGMMLRNENLWPLTGWNGSLSDFVQQHQDRYRIERRPGHEEVLGLFPNSAKLDAPIETYFQASASSSESSSPPRYEPWLWAAFAKEIPVGEKRVVDVSAIMYLANPAGKCHISGVKERPHVGTFEALFSR
jgi:hypothetical protein